MEPESFGAETGVFMPRRGIDWVAFAMALGTVLVLGGTLWMRFGPGPPSEPPGIGAMLPPLRLIDPETSKPMVLLGLRNKVVWVVFCSADSPEGRALMPRLEQVWKRLRAHRRFSLVAASVTGGNPEKTLDRDEVPREGGVPLYLASPETSKRFGAYPAGPPLHLLVDVEGRIAAVARGSAVETVDRLAARVQGWLDELDPLGNTRFALSFFGTGPTKLPSLTSSQARVSPWNGGRP